MTSSEMIGIGWDGIKWNLGDGYEVDEDPKRHQFVRTNVMWQHEKLYGDANKARDLEVELFGTHQSSGKVGLLQDLIHECHEESRLRSCDEAGTPAGSAARGLGSIGNIQTDLYYNDRQEYTASCPDGQTGSSVTVVKEAGTVGSALSVADANARAIQMAQSEATTRLVCEDAAVIYYNTEKQATASCPGPGDDGTPAASGSSVTAIIKAGTYQSEYSQKAADDAAQAAAQAKAEAQLACTFHNKAQTYVATCADGGGDDVEKTVGAGQFTSTISQADADAKALAEAQRLAEEEIDCPDAYTIGNTPQPYNLRRACSAPGCRSIIISFSVVIPANTYVRQTTPANVAQTQLELNQQAQAVAQQQAESVYQNQCRLYGIGCNVTGTGGEP